MNLSDMKQANREAGFHFFERDTMRFFDSRVSSRTFGRFFVTSEQFHGSDGRSGPRRFTVRRLAEDGSVDTVGEFQGFSTLNAALAHAKSRYLAECAR